MLQQPRVVPAIPVAAAWHWTGVGLAMLATTAVFMAMAVYVWRRRAGSAGAALALVLVALLLWAGAYAAELGATDLATIRRWGDLKYVGIVLLPPAWFAFSALFSGRESWVNGRTLALLAIHPVVVLVLLANAATHDLIRWYPPEAATDPDAVAEVGPLFWPHLAYVGVVLWGSLALMVATLVRASRVYRRAATVLIVSLVPPYAANLLYNLDVGPFGRVDLTPFLFIASCGVLVWGLFRFRLLGIRPVARSLVFETISEAVVVLDPLHRVVDANPPAERLLGRPWPTPSAAPWPSCCPRPATPSTSRPRRAATASPGSWSSPGKGRPAATSPRSCPCPTGRGRRSAG
jgi:PAS domain-containing protein